MVDYDYFKKRHKVLSMCESLSMIVMVVLFVLVGADLIHVSNQVRAGNSEPIINLDIMAFWLLSLLLQGLLKFLIKRNSRDYIKYCISNCSKAHFVTLQKAWDNTAAIVVFRGTDSVLVELFPVDYDCIGEEEYFGYIRIKDFSKDI